MPEHHKKRPVHEVRIWPVKAAIWRNEGSNGPWHGVTFERLYGDGEEWNRRQVLVMMIFLCWRNSRIKSTHGWSSRRRRPTEQ